jgi:hypothetical protein
MAWSISHTTEALVYADAQIRALPASKLREAAIGWKSELRESGELRGRGFNVRKLPVDALADFVAEHALGERGRCSSGGWELYVDPDGFITVPFGPDRD